MYVEVEVQADVLCPRCEELVPKLRRLCRELDVPFKVTYAGRFGILSAETMEENYAARTLLEEWISEHATEEQKRRLEKAKPVLEYFRRAGVTVHPVTIVRWHDGVRMREIVIRGYDPRRGDELLSNLRRLLTLIKYVAQKRAR